MTEVLGLLCLGLVTGAIAASLGIGGGIIFVPSLVVFFGFEQHVAQGTSLAIIVPTAVVGMAIHARSGRVEWGVALAIAAGGLIGGVVGARGAIAVGSEALRLTFGALLVAIAVRMLRSG